MNFKISPCLTDAIASTTGTQERDLVCYASTARPSEEISGHADDIRTWAQESSDEYLLCLVANGSREALTVLFRRHATSVFNIARRILRDAGEAEDLVQDLFLFVFQKAGLYDPTKGSAASWIIQMAYHRAIDRRRYLNVRHHYDVQELCEERHLGTGVRTNLDELDATHILNRLRNDLSAEQRQTLELHLFEGYTLREIAERTGQTFGNVRHHYYRSLERLRSYIFEGKRP